MELVLVSVISSIFGLIGLYVLNKNWFDRAKLRHDLEMKKLKYKHKVNKMKYQETPLDGINDKLSGYAKFLPLLKSLDSEQISELVGALTGGSGDDYSGDSVIGEIIENLPPDVIQSFISGLSKNKNNTSNDIIYEK